MAIGWMHIEWLSTLALRSQIPAGAAVLDLGTSDLWAERAPLRRIAARHLGPADCDKVIAAIFAGQKPRPRCQRDFYSIFGAGSYRSIDLGDRRADFALDLNLPLPADTGTYDLVTNFGTTNHVFNVSQTFASIHALLNVGGIQLHTIEVYGYIDHGLYNIHPCLYEAIARANAYEVVDFLYVDNINVRMAQPIQPEPFDFGTLPIQHRDMSETSAFMTKTALQFHRNLESEDTRAALEQLSRVKGRKSIVMPDERLPLCYMFDHMFVALRKTSRSPEVFVTPTQAAGASAPTANEGLGRRPLGR